MPRHLRYPGRRAEQRMEIDGAGERRRRGHPSVSVVQRRGGSPYYCAALCDHDLHGLGYRWRLHSVGWQDHNGHAPDDDYHPGTPTHNVAPDDNPADDVATHNDAADNDPADDVAAHNLP